MTKRNFILILVIALATAALAAPLLLSPDSRETVRADLVAEAASEDVSGYARADGPAPLTFPEDHGPHPDYQTEWWYYTGNLDSPEGRHFGYQLTFFRRALLPPVEYEPRPSAWAGRQAYMAHFALTDVAGERFRAFERLSRGAVELAGAQAAPFQVWLEDWAVSEVSPDVYQLRASAQDNEGVRVALDLTLTDRKGPILQGDQGFSPKGPELGQASYYYSLTRLEAAGQVQIGPNTYPVEGSSWMDHEYSTSALAQDQVGWDWFSMQLDNDYELMVFQIRKADGSVDPFSSGTLVAPDGSATHLSQTDFSIQVEDTWESPRTGAVYPSAWTVRIPKADLTLNITPFLKDQELNVSYAYWEGAVQIQGQQAGQTVRGAGYVELTGYSASMGGEF